MNLNRFLKRSPLLFLLLLPLLAAAFIQDAPQSSGAPGGERSSGGTLGLEIYRSRCAMCHGEKGKGDGIPAALTRPRPRDFTEGKFKFRSTESGSIPTDEDLERSILKGAPGTSMPAWEPFLRGDSLKAVVAYVKSLSPRFASEAPKPLRIGPAVAASPASLAAGKKVYERLECAQCHGTDGEGAGATASDLTDDWGHSIDPTNLTEPWTFRNGSSASDVMRTVSTGLDGTPMPSFTDAATGTELGQLSNYILSMARKPAWSMNADELKTFYDKHRERERSDPAGRGRYLAEIFGCKTCHTPIHEDGTFVEGLSFAGGQRWGSGPYGSYFTDNLTSDKETGLGNWTDDEIKRALTAGISKDGRRFLPLYMPWTSYANLTAEDQSAIVAFLRTLPPVHNRVPKPEPLGIASYLAGKFRMLILHEDFPSIVYPGNAGDAKETNQ